MPLTLRSENAEDKRGSSFENTEQEELISGLKKATNGAAKSPF
jgi:hypothetical protein